MRSKPFFMFDQKFKKRKKSLREIILDKTKVEHEFNESVSYVHSEIYYSYHGTICLVSNTVDQHRPLTEKLVNRTQAKVFRASSAMTFKLGTASVQK